MNQKLIFLFSLPRSGSTLLQRILASHSKICTRSEPWLLLPYFYTLKKSGIYTEYSHKICFNAIQDFIAQLPKQSTDYYQELAKFATSLYRKCMKSYEIYFLEKTPRYYLIIPQIARAFPDSKFIFLFRNPLQILSSMIETWSDKRLRLEEVYLDLFEGPKLLAEGYEFIKDKSISLNYEELLADPNKKIKDILTYLDLKYEKSIIDNFHELKLIGRMGDSTGIDQYKSINQQPLEKVHSILNTKYRKKFSYQYLSHIGDDTLKIMGYDYSDLLLQIKNIKHKKLWMMKDRVDILVTSLYRYCEISMFRKKIGHSKKNGKKIVMHS